MNCNEAKAVLNAYLDKQLDAIETKDVAEHIGECPACGDEYRKLVEVTSAIHSGAVRHKAPGNLERRLIKSLKHYDSKTGFSIASVWSYSLPSLIFGIALGWILMTNYSTRQVRNDELHAVVAAHVRSLMVDHITDVASSDSHTVKPWFHGRLDFSPTVRDLTQQGYPLIGGRMDYIEERAVAALVYRHRKHTINLFVSPLNTEPGIRQNAGYNGYNIIHWDDGQFSYWLISDLNNKDLAHFKELLNAAQATDQH